MLQIEELNRYSRHLILPEFGVQGQNRLKAAKVLVVGGGGLGCPVLQYLAAAGIGTLGIIDFDIIEESNLQRQILFGMADLGRNKAEVAAEKLALLNPYVRFQVYTDRLEAENAKDIFTGFDLVIDGSDNFQTRYLVNDICVNLDIPLVFGSVFKFEGQVAVFNHNGSPTYRCLYPEPSELPACSEIGVLGVLPGIIGSIMANEAIKIITDIGQILSGKLLVFNALENTTDIFTINRTVFADKSPIEKEQPTTCSTKTTVSGISFEELEHRFKANEDVYLVDVREPYEFELGNIGGRNIPLADLPEQLQTFPEEKTIVLCCQTGTRSMAAAQFLKTSGFKGPVFNLENGISGLRGDA